MTAMNDFDSYRAHYEVAKNMSRHTLERALVRDRDARNFGNRFQAYQDALREKIGVEMAAQEQEKTYG